MKEQEKYHSWHTDALIDEAIIINAEIQSRLKSAIYIGSYLEKTEGNDNDYRHAFEALMKQLRGKSD